MTSNILDKIVAYKKKEVSERKKYHQYQSLANLTHNSFLSAIQGKNKVHLIAEIKTASPSQGKIVHNFDLLSTIQIYNRYASAISVLTDSHFFGGSLENLKITRANSNLPLLCKDFIIDEYQIYEARYYGADAILLIASILEVDQLSKFYQIATSLQMSVLFEVHNLAELNKIKLLNPAIIGVNNRNLQDFSIDQNLTIKLSPLISNNTVLVAESGINEYGDIINLTNISDAVLVGTSIIKASSPLAKLKELTQLPAIKICGITNIHDALLAVKSGASYLGLIFAKSPRQITVDQASEIIKAIKANYPLVKIGGVLVNEINTWQIANDLKLDFVQLHGQEDLEFIKLGKLNFTGEIWKSLSISDNNEQNLSNIKLITPLLPYLSVLLLDTFCQDKLGGTGINFNWDFLKTDIIKEIRPLIKIALAGGVKPNNINLARNYCDIVSIIDVSSGVEKSPGIKDEKLLLDLFANLKK